MSTNLTKKDMAKVIVTALYNLESLEMIEKYPAPKRHLKTLMRCKKDHMKVQYRQAHKILAERIEKNE